MVPNYFPINFHTVTNIDSVSNKQIIFKSHIYNIYGVRGVMLKNIFLTILITNIYQLIILTRKF